MPFELDMNLGRQLVFEELDQQPHRVLTTPRAHDYETSSRKKGEGRREKAELCCPFSLLPSAFSLDSQGSKSRSRSTARTSPCGTSRSGGQSSRRSRLHTRRRYPRSSC